MRDIATTHDAGSSNANRTLLGTALNRAVEWQVLARTPMQGVRKVREQPREKVIWTPTRIRQFLAVAREHHLHPLFYLEIVTGLRLGELLGLRWSDLEEDALHVRRSVVMVRGKPTLSTPKTPKGERIVTIPPDAVRVLEAHRQRQGEERALLGESWTETGHIFVSEVGTLLSQDTVRRLWYRLQAKAGVPRARFHDLRHTHISLLIRGELDVVTVADRAGHKDKSVTLDVYGHLFEEQRRAGAVGLDDPLGESEEDGDEAP